MRSLKLASFAGLFLALSLSACTVGGEDDGGGNPPPSGGQPDAGPGGGGGGNPDAAPQVKTCPPSEAEFKTAVFDVALSAKCANACHGSSVPAYKLSASDIAGALTATTAEAKKKNAAGGSVLLSKPLGVNHGGQVQIQEGGTEYKALEKFVGQVTGTPAVCP